MIQIIKWYSSSYEWITQTHFYGGVKKWMPCNYGEGKGKKGCVWRCVCDWLVIWNEALLNA